MLFLYHLKAAVKFDENDSQMQIYGGLDPGRPHAEERLVSGKAANQRASCKPICTSLPVSCHLYQLDLHAFVANASQSHPLLLSNNLGTHQDFRYHCATLQTARYGTGRHDRSVSASAPAHEKPQGRHLQYDRSCATEHDG